MRGSVGTLQNVPESETILTLTLYTRPDTGDEAVRSRLNAGGWVGLGAIVLPGPKSPASLTIVTALSPSTNL